MSKLERLLNLTAALLETERPLTADELHVRVPGYPDGLSSFRRAFERDKDDLREMGIPIRLVPIQGADPPLDGYRIFKDEYYLDDPGLDPDELAALHLATSAVPIEGAGGLEALWKLGGLEPGADDADATQGTPLSSLPGDPRLADLFGALGSRRTAAFRYHDEAREVEPLRLDFQRGRWYLTAFDRVRQAERNFRVDRIVGDVTVGESFTRRSVDGVPGVWRQPWQLGEEPPVRARLLVDADQSVWAVQHLGREAVVDELDGGAMVFEVEVTNRPAFRSFVLTFLEHAEILSPPELRAELVEWLEAIA
jgi:predicted DNA-binding transcriptional regulator YafY